MSDRRPQSRSVGGRAAASVPKGLMAKTLSGTGLRPNVPTSSPADRAGARAFEHEEDTFTEAH